MLDAKEIFAQQVRNDQGALPWRAVSVDRGRGQGFSAVAEQLLFVRGVHEPGEPEVGKKDGRCSCAPTRRWR